MSFEQKYKKYKKKYLEMKNQITSYQTGGAVYPDGQHTHNVMAQTIRDLSGKVEYLTTKLNDLSNTVGYVDPYDPYYSTGLVKAVNDLSYTVGYVDPYDEYASTGLARSVQDLSNTVGSTNPYYYNYSSGLVKTVQDLSNIVGNYNPPYGSTGLGRHLEDLSNTVGNWHPWNKTGLFKDISDIQQDIDNIKLDVSGINQDIRDLYGYAQNGGSKNNYKESFDINDLFETENNSN